MVNRTYLPGVPIQGNGQTEGELAASLFQTDWRRDIDRVGPAVGDILAFANSALTSVVDTARLPLPSTRRFERRLALLDSVLYPLIAERRRSPGGEDLVSMLLEVADSETGDGLTDKQVRDETISFFIAGHATIASALTWTWYLLSTHPTVWRKLRANVALCPYVTTATPGSGTTRRVSSRSGSRPRRPGPGTAWPSSPSQAVPGAASARASPCSSSPWWWPWWPSATGSACSRPARPRSRRPSPSGPAPRC